MVRIVIFLITFAALSISTGTMWIYAFTAPILAHESPVLFTPAASGIVKAVIGSMFLYQIEWLLIGIVVLKAKEIPPWTILAALGSTNLFVVMTTFAHTQFQRLVDHILIGAGLLAIYYVLWNGERLKAVDTNGEDIR